VTVGYQREKDEIVTHYSNGMLLLTDV